MADAKKTSSQKKLKMLQFVNTERDMPAKRDADVRNEDYLEIYGECAFLSKSLPASEQHPRLAKTDCRRPDTGSLGSLQRHK